MAESKMVVYEDKDILVVDKPSGMVTTNEGKDEKNSLENWLKANRPIDLSRNGIMHRLDKGTSGLVLVAKNINAFENLKKQFKKRTIGKKYYALICGDLPYEGEINMPIGRSAYGFGKFSVNVEGKPAWTKFRVIDKYRNNGKIYSLTEVDLKTGRTHQIRVHFANLKWPLLGDKLYGGEEVSGTDRPFLHAHEIKFVHPESGKEVVFESKIPDEFTDLLGKYEKVA